jgi:hypothetical protein
MESHLSSPGNMHKSLSIYEFTALFIGIPREWQCLGRIIFKVSRGEKESLTAVWLKGAALKKEPITSELYVLRAAITDIDPSWF